MKKSEIIEILEGKDNLEEGFLDTLGAKMRGWEQSNNNSYNTAMDRDYENQDPKEAKADRYVEFMVDKLTDRFQQTMSKIQNMNNRELDKDLKRMFGDDEDYKNEVKDNIIMAVSNYILDEYFSHLLE